MQSGERRHSKAGEPIPYVDNAAENGGENSPAIHRWENGRVAKPSPAGTKETFLPFLTSLPGLCPHHTPEPSDESLGYCQRRFVNKPDRHGTAGKLRRPALGGTRRSARVSAWTAKLACKREKHARSDTLHQYPSFILNPGMEAKEWGQGNECQNLAGRITLTHRVTRPEFVTSASLFLCPHSSAIHFRF